MMDGGGHQRRKMRFRGAEVNASERGLPFSLTSHTSGSLCSHSHLIFTTTSISLYALLSLHLRNIHLQPFSNFEVLALLI